MLDRVYLYLELVYMLEGSLSITSNKDLIK